MESFFRYTSEHIDNSSIVFVADFVSNISVGLLLYYKPNKRYIFDTRLCLSINIVFRPELRRGGEIKFRIYFGPKNFKPCIQAQNAIIGFWLTHLLYR